VVVYFKEILDIETSSNPEWKSAISACEKAKSWISEQVVVDDYAEELDKACLRYLIKEGYIYLINNNHI
jgi:hypothetical protein